MPKEKDFQKRRLEIRKQLTTYEKECRSLQKEIKSLRRLQQLQQLEGLERLEGLQRLQQLEGLRILNESYENVSISTPVDKTIIYLDPPYRDTGKYQLDIIHKDLWDYVDKTPYKVYISSYGNVPFKEVLSLDHRTTFRMNAGAKNKKTKEKLFCNTGSE